MSSGGRWICMICNHVYDPAEGDPEAGIPPGTPFEALPDDWQCPECGVSKDMYEPHDD
ncbi:rubredoxin [Algihabitans albus]|uniref:rubredoxin n=1 Tax=Algihabitans albus TaxID=2164067 RepID=UPI0035D03CC6